MIDDVLEQIRTAVKARGWTAAELACKADVSWATVRHINDENWSPTVKTLRKIEGAIRSQTHEGEMA